MPHSPADKYRRFRAPRQNGEALFDPPWDQLPKLIAANRQAIVTNQHAIADRAVSEVAAAARQEVLTAAHRFTSSFTNVPELPAGAPERPIVVSGHQPELFHPGVWLKNFALDALARQSGGVGVHLLIDSDLCRGVAVRTPTGSVDSPHIEAVAYDQTAPEVAYEERGIRDADLLATFGARVAGTLGDLIERPLASRMTDNLLDAGRATGNLGLALSQARRKIEGEWGATTLELPFSSICNTDSFRWFVGCLLDDLPQLHKAYNAALADYRQSHKLRSAAQPLPDLTQHDDWRETPLWVWTDADPTRRPLFARRTAGALQLSDLAGRTWSCDSKHNLIARLAELRSEGVKLRSRALATTLYARLFLGDLFLHGIGGAKYDQVTDEFARRLLGFAPPPHATLTATLRLPIDFPVVDPAEDVQLKRQLRELRYHPEKHAENASSQVTRLIAEKQSAVAQPRSSGSNRNRHERIERANAALQPLLAAKRREARQRLEASADRQRVAAVLGSREFSFCLFPEAYLRNEMRRLVPLV